MIAAVDKGQHMTIITAPEGAIFSLLAIATGAPLAPNEEAETWLHEQALIGHSGDGSVLEVTSRGRAFIAMIGQTPLPVRVERWDDPRGTPAAAPAPSAPAIDTAAIAQFFATVAALSTAKPTASIASMIQTPAPQAPAPTAATTLPPGWTPNTYTDLPPGQIPPGLQRDWELTCFRRDGRQLKNLAGVVIYKHTGKGEDVLGWIRSGDPSESMTVPPQVATIP